MSFASIHISFIWKRTKALCWSPTSQSQYLFSCISL
uniref:Uncharacterized protein n=1 Tax=Brassica campestris TaxID=3711 RepID=A0A3P6CC29_BRACM|nr:unnamed protein product [Brassica rapa]